MTAEMRSSIFACVVLAALATALAALAGGGPKIKPTSADTAAAKATMIRMGDLRPAGSWMGGPVTPSHQPVVCPGFNPKQSDLVITGSAESDWSGTALVFSSTDVLQTARMVRLDWQRSVKTAGFTCALSHAGVTNVSASEVAFPKLTPLATAFRATYDARANGKTTHLVVEFAAVGSSRSELSVAEFRPMPASLGALHADVVRLSRLMLTRAKA